MTYKSNTPNSQESIFVSKGGDDLVTGFTQETPVLTIAQGITNAVASGATNINIGDGDFDEQLIVPDSINIRGEGAALISTTASTVTLTASNSSTIDVGFLSASASNSSTYRVNGKSRALLDCTTMILGTFGGPVQDNIIGIDILGVNDDIPLCITTSECRATNSTFVKVRGDTDTPPRLALGTITNFENGFTIVDHAPSDVTQITEVTVSFTNDTVSAATGLVLFKGTAGTLNVVAQQLNASGETIAIVGNGFRFGITAPAVAGNLIVESGGVCNLTAIGLWIGNITVETGGILNAGINTLNGDITVQTGGTLNCVIGVHTGTITRNGTINGQINDGGKTFFYGGFRIVQNPGNSVNIDVPAVVTDYTMILPPAQGTVGQIQQLDSSLEMQWVDEAGSVPGGSNTQVQFNDGGVFNGISGITTDGINLDVSGRIDGAGTAGLLHLRAGANSPIGGEVKLEGGGASTTGGKVQLQGGLGGTNGGDIELFGGEGPNNKGGSIIATGGLGGTDDGSGEGGDVVFTGGVGGFTSGNGGDVVLNAGSGAGGSSGMGGEVAIKGGNSLGPQPGGDVIILGGDGGSSSNTGGNMIFAGGTGGDVNGTGGSFFLLGGSGGILGNSNGGDVNISSGVGFGTGTGGDIVLEGNGGDIFLQKTSGKVGVGTITFDDSAILEVTSASKGFLMPRMTTAERDNIASPATGLEIYNITTNAPEYFDGSAWAGTAGNETLAQTLVNGNLTGGTNLSISSGDLIVSPDGVGTSPGGLLKMDAGDGGLTSGDGGGVAILSGQGRGGNANSGSIEIEAGTPNGSGSFGSLNLQSQGGNVGIGVALQNPTTLLDMQGTNPILKISGDANFQQAELQLHGGRDQNGADLALLRAFNFRTGSDVEVARISTAPGTGTDSGRLKFFTKVTGNAIAETMRIDVDGKVGIGTEGPSAKLTVKEDSANVATNTVSVILNENTTASNWAELDFKTLSSVTSEVTGVRLGAQYLDHTDASIDADFVIKTTHNNILSERFRISDGVTNVVTGSLNINQGNIVSPGGTSGVNLSINSGDGSAGNGGDLNLISGLGFGSGGAVNLTAGDGAFQGGPININSGAASSSNSAGGLISLQSGSSSGTAAGGQLHLFAGIGGDNSGTGGQLLVHAGGGGNPQGTGGLLSLEGGQGFSSGNTDGGNVEINGGPAFGTGTLGQVLINGIEASRIGVEVKEIFTAADLDALATGGVITVTGTDLQLIFKDDVATSNRFVTDGATLRMGGAGSSFTLTYTGTGDFFSGTGNYTIRAGVTLQSASTGTLWNIDQPNNSLVIHQDANWVNWDDHGTIKGGIVSFQTLNLVLWTGPLVFDSNQFVNVETIGTLLVPSSGHMFEIKNQEQEGSIIRFFNVTAVLTGTTTTIYKVDPAILDSTQMSVISGTVVDGGGNFDTTGINGTFTDTNNATVALTTIDSVTNSSGVARFNFTVGPTLFVNQEVDITNFVTQTNYNQTGMITVVGAGFFEIVSIAFTADDATGDFSSDSITLEDIGTALVDGDTLVIDGNTESTYDGGATVYNQLTNSFQINRNFTLVQVAGTWDTSGLDQKDPRLLAQLQQTQPNSEIIAFGSMNANTNVTPTANGTYGPLVVTGFTDNSITERFKLINTEAVVYEYIGNEPCSCFAAALIWATKTGSTGNYRFSLSINGAIPVFATADYSPMEVKTTKVQAAEQDSVLLTKGDTVQLMIAGDGTADDPTITDFKMTIK